MRGLLSLAVIALCLAACSSAPSTQVASSGSRYIGCTHFGGSSLVPAGATISGCGAFPPAQTVF